MKKILIVMLLVLFFAIPNVFAENITMLDEMTLGIKLQSQDCILTSDHIDIGAEISSSDLTNSKTAKATFNAMGVVTIKGWSIFDMKGNK